ncbi:hypothetical protein CEUSTIGMA_g7418.t1 [Chlamydomonas eustigma]|uniref:AB hydrolase-1 domain-containing protein n=1 Tax=Chlamydomonas eustigma TaxID=1157962 RepID=A0A250XAS0_9CHLO|nr:hypothetical protein CEUSTIGMA_g7418.t1 [Chlamydomonas eustigma]|eukprot:GAX79979.1 hypothetical protein CEUSTIGMA_g7418.t1 [Chlamydomonas eustigma]
MEGELLKYSPASEHLAFVSGKYDRHVILIAGLTEGMLGLSYSRPLSKALNNLHWSLVQIQLSSSYSGYGTSCLDTDALEVHMLMQYLRQHHASKSIVLLGHSTGCQIVVRYMQKRSTALADGDACKQALGEEHVFNRMALRDTPPILGTVLQAAVSDREYLCWAHRDFMEAAQGKAEAMIKAGQGDDICCRFSPMGGAPISAFRLLSLYLRFPLGDDDMFSSDLSDEELSTIMSPLSGAGIDDSPAEKHRTTMTPPNAPGPSPATLILLSGSDEYVPPFVDIPVLADRLARAVGPSTKHSVVQGGSHALIGNEKEASDLIAGFVSELSCPT